MTAEAPIDSASIGETLSRSASHTIQVIAMLIAAPTAPVSASLLLAFGDGKSCTKPCEQ
jgi:hypothetical protein